MKEFYNSKEWKMLKEKMYKGKPVKNLTELSHRLRGTREGCFYYCESFIIDFERAMHLLNKLQTENIALREKLLIREEIYSTSQIK